MAQCKLVQFDAELNDANDDANDDHGDANDDANRPPVTQTSLLMSETYVVLEGAPGSKAELGLEIRLFVTRAGSKTV